jgi:exosortase/archaeosortase family protein
MVSVLSLGLLIAYLGNLFRMIVIGVIGYHYGIDALLWAHNNVGWMVFLSWSSVFWYAVMKLVSRKATPPVEGLSSK